VRVRVEKPEQDVGRVGQLIGRRRHIPRIYQRRWSESSQCCGYVLGPYVNDVGARA
jgi:hypothetical protein